MCLKIELLNTSLVTMKPVANIITASNIVVSNDAKFANKIVITWKHQNKMIPFVIDKSHANSNLFAKLVVYELTNDPKREDFSCLTDFGSILYTQSNLTLVASDNTHYRIPKTLIAKVCASINLFATINYDFVAVFSGITRLSQTVRFDMKIMQGHKQIISVNRVSFSIKDIKRTIQERERGVIVYNITAINKHSVVGMNINFHEVNIKYVNEDGNAISEFTVNYEYFNELIDSISTVI